MFLEQSPFPPLHLSLFPAKEKLRKVSTIETGLFRRYIIQGTITTLEDSSLLLLELTKRASCGNQLTPSFAQKSDGNRHYYYRCMSATKYGSGNCPNRNVPALELESFTERVMFQIVSDSEFFDAVCFQMKGNSKESLHSKEAERDVLVTNRTSVKKQQRVLLGNLELVGLQIDNAPEVKDLVQTLRSQIKGLELKIQALDWDIQNLKTQQLDRKGLREIFRSLPQIYAEAIPEVKRRLLNVINEEIRCHRKRGDSKGEIVYKLWGDGTIKQAWQEAKKRGVKKTLVQAV